MSHGILNAGDLYERMSRVTNMIIFIARPLISISIPQFSLYYNEAQRSSNSPKNSTSNFETLIGYISYKLYCCTKITKNFNIYYGCCHPIFSQALFFSLVVNDLIEEHKLLYLKSISQKLCLVSMDPLKLHPYWELILPPLFTTWGCILKSCVPINSSIQSTRRKFLKSLQIAFKLHWLREVLKCILIVDTLDCFCEPKNHLRPFISYHIIVKNICMTKTHNLRKRHRG